MAIGVYASMHVGGHVVTESEPPQITLIREPDGSPEC